jgi:deazaflavin-dependent oxidoreductase (nitroreductase family)
MPAVRLNPVLRVAWKFHRSLLEASGGRIGSRMGGFTVLLLETIGDSWVLPRSVSLSHLEEDGRDDVAASCAGEDRDSAWARNLRAHPEASVNVRARTLPVIARELEGAEREAVFRRFVEREASNDVYRRRRSREIPVFEPRPREV